MMMPSSGFDAAIVALKEGKRVTRKGWNGQGMWLSLVLPAEQNHLPYIQMSTVNGQLVPWLASQTDMLANDWMIVEAV